MVTKLPAWVILGGVVLSFMAGYVNAIGFLGVTHQSLTHLTGVVSQMAIGLAIGDLAKAAHLSLVMVAFFCGTVLSGFIVQQNTLRLGRRYGVVLLLEAGLLLIAIQFFHQSSHVGDYLAATAMGLQNAMASTYSGALIRTTHLTGFVTDFGIAIGHLLRGLPIDRLRFRLYGLIFLGFLSGGVLGAWFYSRVGFDALYLPVAFVGTLGLSYFIAYYAGWLPRVTPSDFV